MTACRRLRPAVAAVMLALTPISAGAEIADTSKSAVVDAPALANAPPAFQIKEGRVVFVDFEHVETKLRVALDQTSVGQSAVDFVQAERGLPVINLDGRVTALRIDGRSIDPALLEDLEAPDGTSRLTALKIELEPGRHRLEVDYLNSENRVLFSGKEFRYAFQMNDFAGRFLEQFMPANLEFDQTPVSLTLEIADTEKSYEVVANGPVTRISDQAFRIEYPAHYTASGQFLHVFESQAFDSVAGEFVSADGRTIPITVVGHTADHHADLAPALETIRETLRRGEAMFGPYPHPFFKAVIGPSAMEYVGATFSGPGNLAHEVLHSFIARGLIPANGPAALVDEAVVVWILHGWDGPQTERVPASILCDLSEYSRRTGAGAYGPGSWMMEGADRVFRGSGGLLPRLRSFYAQWVHHPYQLSDFLNHLLDSASATERVELEALFRTYGDCGRLQLGSGASPRSLHQR